MLELKQITKIYELGKLGDKNYQTVTALNGVDVCFGDTEFISILGPSGCGKTTLLNIIGGLDHYTEGDLIINGISTKEYKDKDWDNYRNHKIGFVFQTYNLIPHLTVLENVELALTLSGTNKQIRRQKAIDSLIRVGLEDKINARPNQLSGGQMQRVAIARAIVNDPDIILADEPTGALDTKTSVQIMEILKEISKEKLIIMVTHNPELAETYSTRIIRLIDGKIIDDSAPLIAEEVVGNENKNEKTSMSYLTALSLSGKNLLTKKGRTALVSFAGSIGIIGISLILSLSSGFQMYIDDVQKDTLSTYPLSISKEVVDYTSILQAMMSDGGDVYYEDAEGKIHANPQMIEMFNNILKESTSNKLKDFKSYIENNEEIFSEYTISYSYNLDLNVYDKNNHASLNPSTVFTDLLKKIGEKTGSSDISQYVAQASMLNQSVFSEMLDNPKLLSEQYDLVGDQSRWPTNYDECVLVVNDNNTINDYHLYALGLSSKPTLDEIAQKLADNMMSEDKDEEFELNINPIEFEKLLNTKYKILLNTDYYKKQENGTYIDVREEKNNNKLNAVIDDENIGIDLKIVGIVKPNKNAVAHSITTPIGYTSSLTKEIINRVNATEILINQKTNPDIDVLTGLPFPNDNRTIEEKRTELMNLIDTLTREDLIAIIGQDIPSSVSDDMLKQMMKGQISSANEETINSYYASFMDENTYTNNMMKFGDNDLSDPAGISFYCVDFESKDELKLEIDKYNETVKKDPNKGSTYVIAYTDFVAVMMSSISTVIDSISYVLISFVSVSLIVSSIMIGIITYISVLERTKEIGVLRSIGASKRDIKNVFTAESLIIGLISGVLGISVTLLLNIPINIIIEALTGISGVASLPILGGVILVLLSCFLTFIAGLIPSNVASKKDPVIALRSE